MTSITLTELNQNPSRATRLADRGEVIVMRRGRPAYRIARIEPAGDSLEELVAAGLARPPAVPLRGPRGDPGRSRPLPIWAQRWMPSGAVSMAWSERIWFVDSSLLMRAIADKSTAARAWFESAYAAGDRFAHPGTGRVPLRQERGAGARRCPGVSR